MVATAANGCKAIAYTQAATYPEPTVSITGPTSAACDPATGLFSPAVTLTTPNGPYTFLWSNGSTSYTTSVTNPGTYTVTVTTSNGRIKTQTHTVNCACGSPCPTCIDGGACDGNGILVSSQILTAPSGNSYLWSPGNQTTQTISTNIPGVLYSVVVTDNSNIPCPQTTYSFYLHCTNDTCPYSGNPTCTANTPFVTQGNAAQIDRTPRLLPVVGTSPGATMVGPVFSHHRRPLSFVQRQGVGRFFSHWLRL